MNTDPPKPAKQDKLSCVVLVSNTLIGPAYHGKGSKVQLDQSTAEALAKLNPPRVRIEGVA